jgi:hypothetical protein
MVRSPISFCASARLFGEWLTSSQGNSFTGMRSEAIVVRGKPLYWRGRYIIDAVMADLAVNPLASQFWNNAEQVMITGCSAGGLASILHGDYVLSNIPSTPSVAGIVSMSGFFLGSNNLNGIPVYPEEIQGAFYLANATEGLPAACVAEYPDAPYLCNFAPIAFQTMKNRLFLLNSMYDIWQVRCIMLAELVPSTSTENGNCAALWSGQPVCGTWQTRELGNCTDSQINSLNGYSDLFLNTIRNMDQRNGAFICSCLSHCEAVSACT